MTNTTMLQTINTARTIATHAREELGRADSPFWDGSHPLPPSHIENALQFLLDGSMYNTVNTPAVWAATVDAQLAADLLTKAEHAEQARECFQAESYRLAANRKLAEAVSWLY